MAKGLSKFLIGGAALITVALLGALVITPAAVFARDNYDKSDVRATGAELSVQINNNGSTRVSGATVTSVGSSTLVAQNSFGSTTLTWTVNTNSSTKFVDKGGKNYPLANIAVGDVISFVGTLNAGSNSLTVTATQVKDWSKSAKIFEKHVFEGSLLSAIGTTTLPTTMSLKVGNTTYTVQIGAGVPILSKNWATTNLGTFMVGDSVRVYGSVQPANLSVIDAVVVRNASR